jgi:hypothetical protein
MYTPILAFTLFMVETNRMHPYYTSHICLWSPRNTANAKRKWSICYSKASHNWRWFFALWWQELELLNQWRKEQVQFHSGQRFSQTNTSPCNVITIFLKYHNIFHIINNFVDDVASFLWGVGHQSIALYDYYPM